jgi:SAM-dependent methyltransferase
MDDVKVDLARERAAVEGVTNVEFRVLSVYDWSEPATYDLVYCRNVIQHLARPVDVLRQMWAALRPGGLLIVEDADFEGASFCYPPSPAFDFWVTAYQEALRRSGGDPTSGRKLHSRFVEAGIPAPTLGVVQRVDATGEAKTMPHWTVSTTAEAIVREGIATAGEVEEALAGLLALAADAGTVIGSPRICQAWSRKAG